MNINRHNYEEYFILYLDNELDSESRREIEVFAAQNPDLKAELDILLQSKLTPDNDIAFADKGSLMRFDSSSISLANYEEWLTSYIDNELAEEERKDVEKFIAANPAVQKELNLLQQAKLQPETIVFPFKESLYRKEEKARVVAIRWWRIAAAAVLLLSISVTAIILLNNTNKGGNESVDFASEQSKKEKTTDTTVQQVPTKTPVNDQVVIADQGNKETINPIAVVPKKKAEETKEQSSQVKNEEPLLAINNEDNPTNNSSQLTKENPNATGTGNADIVNNGSQTNDQAKEAGLTIDKPSIETGTVTTETLQPSYAVEQQSSGNNNNKGLRGFLRKVTRTFEKRTNIKATDDDDRLLIAGLALKL